MTSTMPTDTAMPTNPAGTTERRAHLRDPDRAAVPSGR